MIKSINFYLILGRLNRAVGQFSIQRFYQIAAGGSAHLFAPLRKFYSCPGEFILCFCKIFSTSHSSFDKLFCCFYLLSLVFYYLLHFLGNFVLCYLFFELYLSFGDSFGDCIDNNLFGILFHFNILKFTTQIHDIIEDITFVENA